MIPITQNLLQTLENQSTQNFSTDLTLSCELHTELNANKCNEEEARRRNSESATNSRKPKDPSAFFLVHTHIMAFFSADSVKKIESNGLSVTVFDQDSTSDYELVFKKWHSSKSYVFNGKWHGDFVVRRELKVGDIIGLYWDPRHSKFNFCVLQTAH
ncbi:b3 domain-containing protein [Quercus suber]|uniref:B3 domain-containing protein n=1 Tax=Quercus suber TaxID=58331 RepID=A0AAW0IZN3_QUESU